MRAERNRIYHGLNTNTNEMFKTITPDKKTCRSVPLCTVCAHGCIQKAHAVSGQLPLVTTLEKEPTQGTLRVFEEASRAILQTRIDDTKRRPRHPVSSSNLNKIGARDTEDTPRVLPSSSQTMKHRRRKWRLAGSAPRGANKFNANQC